MRSPDGKSQRGDDGGKGIGSSGNDEETEDGSKPKMVDGRGGEGSGGEAASMEDDRRH